MKEIKYIIFKIVIILKNIIYYFKLRKYKKHKKIIYALTPPACLRNIGDHAQVIAIKKWFRKHFKNYSVLEFDKDEVYNYISIMKNIVNRKDLIFLHSGGNLSDRALWSENGRRLIIKSFPQNKIISLPQTIYFHNTLKGKKELEITKNIYNNHKQLTVIARDPVSFRLAREYFPKCKIMVFPDFVLSSDISEYLNSEVFTQSKDILLCLRRDGESALTAKDMEKIKKYIKLAGKKFTEFDTTLDYDIQKKYREEELKKTLKLFIQHRLVITDRLHGIIFSVIAKKPCIALKTVDHKITASLEWFKDLNYLFYINSINELYEVIDRAIKIQEIRDIIDWNKKYFDKLAEILKSEIRIEDR